MSDPRSCLVSSDGLEKPRRRHASVNRSPQRVIDDYWQEFASKTPGKVTSIIPQTVFADKAARRIADKLKRGSQTASASYEEAAAQCRAKVAHIVKECRRVNQKYRDPHFDLDVDLNINNRDCIDGLDNSAPGGVQAGEPKREYEPQSVKRVADIFDNPQFFIDGPTANDVRQGHNGDCWLLAALCTLSNKPGLIERVCVAHDASVGVYGFVFHRDGEWFSEIIDDKLYLKSPDYDDSNLERNLLEDRVRTNTEEEYRKVYQSNSSALYFAQCDNPNETWLPLLEKAYAKAHGDYTSIDGGLMGEGIEDLTGGVTSELYATDILDKEYFWKEELKKVNDMFLFGCSTGIWGRGRGERDGIVEGHAYSIMRAVEINGQRLVLLKNPWGEHEWKGAWSDGSKEWTADWIQKLNHKFGDDGSFWISYEDLLRKYQCFDRTRLFGPDWKIASTWTSMTVPWTYEYNETKFAFSLARDGPVVLVLSQLDERYFRGLEGQYIFQLSFRLHRLNSNPIGQDPDLESSTGNSNRPGTERERTNSFNSSTSTESELKPDDDADYVVRCQFGYRMMRSVSVELDLEAGQYVVLVRIKATRDDGKLPAEDVVRDSMEMRREKLIHIGMAYDIAHSKGRIVETPAEKKTRTAAMERQNARNKARNRKLFAEHYTREREQNHAVEQFNQKQKRKRRAKTKEKKQRQHDRRQKRWEEREKKLIEEEDKRNASEKEKKVATGEADDGVVKKETRDEVDKIKETEKASGKEAEVKSEEKVEKAEKEVEEKVGEKEVEKKVEDKIEEKAEDKIEERADKITDGAAPTSTAADATLNTAIRTREQSDTSASGVASVGSGNKPVVVLAGTTTETPSDGPVAKQSADAVADTPKPDTNLPLEFNGTHLSPASATEPKTKSTQSLATSTPSTEGKNTPTASVADGESQTLDSGIKAELGGAQGDARAYSQARVPDGIPTGNLQSPRRGRSRNNNRMNSNGGQVMPSRRSPPGPGYEDGYQHDRDFDDESDLSSIPSLSELSDGELDFMYKNANRDNKHESFLYGEPTNKPMSNGMGNSGSRTGPKTGSHRHQQQPAPHRDCRGDHCYQCPHATPEDKPNPWNAIAVVGLRIYYQEVEGDKERLAAAEAKIEAEKAAKKKAEGPSKSKPTTKSTKAKSSTSTKTKSSKPKTSKVAVKTSKENEKTKDKDGDDATHKDIDPKTERAANGDHIVQLWVERPHPFMPAISDSESESDSEYDSDSDDDDSSAGDAEDDGAIGQGAENTLDIDDTLKDSTLTLRQQD